MLVACGWWLVEGSPEKKQYVPTYLQLGVVRKTVGVIGSVGGLQMLWCRRGISCGSLWKSPPRRSSSQFILAIENCSREMLRINSVIY